MILFPIVHRLTDKIKKYSIGSDLLVLIKKNSVISSTVFSLNHCVKHCVK